MNRQDLGRATEARFLVDAHRNGFIVSRPFDSVPSYDAILDNGRRLYRVQIKGARSEYRTQKGTSYRINTNRHGVRGPRFDVCAVWLESDGKWVFLPSHVSRRKMVRVTPNGKHSHRGWEIFRR
jgi:hypothetical protein